MELAAIIISVISMLISIPTLVLLLVKHFSTHTVQYEPISLENLEKLDGKLNEKVDEIENEEEDWL